jgi:hypothetical protein
MQMSKCVTVAAACLFGFLSLVVAGDKSEIAVAKYVIEIPPFDRVQRQERDDGANAVAEAYFRAKENLLGQLHYAKTGEQKTIVIFLLGRLRAKEAIDDLVKMIDFRAAYFDPKTRFARWGEYPAQEALQKIGTPCEISVLDALGKEKSELRRKLFLEVLRNVYGPKICLLVLDDASKSGSAEERVNYEEAARSLRDKLKRKSGQRQLE